MQRKKISFPYKTITRNQVRNTIVCPYNVTIYIKINPYKRFALHLKYLNLFYYKIGFS